MPMESREQEPMPQPEEQEFEFNTLATVHFMRKNTVKAATRAEARAKLQAIIRTAKATPSIQTLMVVGWAVDGIYEFKMLIESDE